MLNGDNIFLSMVIVRIKPDQCLAQWLIHRKYFIKRQPYRHRKRDAIFVFIFSVFSNVLKCICVISEMGKKCYIGQKG